MAEIDELREKIVDKCLEQKRLICEALNIKYSMTNEDSILFHMSTIDIFFLTEIQERTLRMLNK